MSLKIEGSGSAVCVGGEGVCVRGGIGMCGLMIAICPLKGPLTPLGSAQSEALRERGPLLITGGKGGLKHSIISCGTCSSAP